MTIERLVRFNEEAQTSTPFQKNLLLKPSLSSRA